jgi:hypothetical protein
MQYENKIGVTKGIYLLKFHGENSPKKVKKPSGFLNQCHIRWIGFFNENI